ncbi:MAG TPA: hypothetical protein VHI93_08780 [Candidatus Thermoplasmatota archaeon]|nr:hypothetical protein [Candidatus Thermoplasmatota archaeon]
MHREAPRAGGSHGQDDLPPLPSKHYRPRPQFTCQRCKRHFVRAEELDAHARGEHAEEAPEGQRQGGG